MHHPRLSTAILALVLTLLAGCGSGDGTTGPGTEDPSPAGFLVGSWIAEELVLTNSANPDESLDLIAEFDAEFTLDVQESGRYLAILTGFGQSSSESGTLRVSGDILTMTAEFPVARTTAGTVTKNGNRVTIEAETIFDFNFDGIPEEAEMRAVMVPRL